MNNRTFAPTTIQKTLARWYNGCDIWDKCINEKAPLQGAIFKHTSLVKERTHAQ